MYAVSFWVHAAVIKIKFSGSTPSALQLAFASPFIHPKAKLLKLAQ